MRVGRVPEPTGQQKETAARMVLVGSGRQVDGRTGGDGNDLDSSDEVDGTGG